MKRMCVLIVAILLLTAGMTGCGVREIAEMTEPGPVTVTSVDELLAALAPGANIRLGAGSYMMSEASDYGNAPEGAWYFWEEQEDGYQLVIRNLQNLTIQGDSRESTILETGPQYARVLTLDGCANVCLENLSIGHSVSGEKGAGLELKNCDTVSLRNLDISNCGTAGVTASSCQNVSVRESEIADCTFMGVHVLDTDGLKLENCRFTKLGNTEHGGGSVFCFTQTQNILVTGCEISNNQVFSIIDCYPCENVVFEKNQFAENQIHRAFFDVDGGLVFDSNIVEGNNLADWFTAERSTVLDGIGKSWNAEMLQWYYQPPVETSPEGSRTEITVTNADEFLAAIGPNTEILLDGAFFDLSTAKDYGTGYSNYYYWNEEFDGPSLVITDVDNLVIRGSSKKDCTISAVPRYAHVLSFRRCSNISLSGFTAGHTVEPGYCMGGVLFFRDCDNMTVEDCGLYGCGTLGVQAELCGGVTVKNCDIYECSYGGIQMSEVMGVVIENCSFRDLGGDSMTFYDCKDVTIDGDMVAGNARIA